jgi:ribosomal protein L37AE/L43A
MVKKRCPGCGSTDVQQVGTNWLCQSCQSTKAMTLDEIVECKAQ